MVHNTIGFMREKIYSFYHGHVTHLLKVNNPKMVENLGNIDQNKIIFPLTPNLIGFASKNFLPLTP